ncbi:MAG: hypothetical protein EPN79_11305 [Burkholderiaceae bacterium]|nr:MAG: hypothetical protein EPN79_11305 [Burkholderiaceae bacterium]TBR76730.1 MAG: hypothetical protein EPN64_05770 [Burkholderiaceae bacterium]
MATLAGLLGGLQERVLQPPSFLVDSSALAPAFIRQSLQWVNESRAEAGRAPLGISDLLVLDDRKEFFIGDAELTQRLLLTNPDLGLSDEGTAAKLRRWADRMEDDAQGSHEDDGGHSSSSKY